MIQLWNAIERLNGQIIETVTGSKFKVVDVTERTVVIEVQSSRKVERVHRGQIELAFSISGTDASPGNLRRNGVKGSAGYIAGILRALPM